jgi:hypothetical protein
MLILFDASALLALGFLYNTIFCRATCSDVRDIYVASSIQVPIRSLSL